MVFYIVRRVKNASTIKMRTYGEMAFLTSRNANKHAFWPMVSIVQPGTPLRKVEFTEVVLVFPQHRSSIAKKCDVCDFYAAPQTIESAMDWKRL